LLSFFPSLCALLALARSSFKILDKGSKATTPNILPPPYVLKLGQFFFEVSPKDDVKPNFRTPPMMFHVRQEVAAKDI
jgi:hypothetical protein